MPYSRILASFALLSPSERGSAKPILMSWLPPLFCKENYLKTKNTIVHALLASDITVTDRRYIGHEDDTGYHHYAIDVAKSYVWED